MPENDDDVCSHRESHLCANDGDRLIEKIDDVISQMSGADFYRENGGDQVPYSTVSGFVTCHENMSQKTENEILSAALYHCRLTSGMFPESVVGARYSECCRMTTDHALLFRWSLTVGIALLRLLKVAARHCGSSLRPEAALYLGWRLRLHLGHCWFDELPNVTFLTIQCKKFIEPNINIVAKAAVGSLDRSYKSYSEYSSG